ncbi:MAG: glycosyl transferase [Cyanobacteria bacterium 13_1_40CM_2_61_4]|nr:MAG: glycosyl transferase [Cyanobacteria bacterium 13_1_40CM_2_61_4]
MLNDVEVLILTYNEAPNIGRTLDRLLWARRVVVIDSFSLDQTSEIVRKYSNVELLQREFDNHANQWNFGLSQIRSDWVLSLDADYEVSDTLVQELTILIPNDTVDAYFANFTYRVAGYPLRGTLYPPRAVLFRGSCCVYEQEGHTQVLRINGNHGWIHSVIYHDDRKPLTHWLRSQDKYALLETAHLLGASPSELNVADRLRRWIVPAPFLVFFYTLLIKGLILDGWAGWQYALQRTLAEVLLSIRLIEARLNRVNAAGSST